MRATSGAMPEVDDRGGKEEYEVRGELAPVASQIIMKVLRAARMARFDLAKAVNELAKHMQVPGAADKVEIPITRGA